MAGSDTRRDRKRLARGLNLKAHSVACDLNVSILQDAPVLVSKHRDEYFVSEAFFRGTPVDLRIRVVAAQRAILQARPTNSGALPAQRHKHRRGCRGLAQGRLREPGARKRSVRGRTAEFFVHALRVDDVVAVHVSRVPPADTASNRRARYRVR